MKDRIHEEAGEWLVSFRLGEVDAAGRREFEAWMRQSPEHLRAYLELAAIWDEGDALDAAHKFEPQELLARAADDFANVVPMKRAGIDPAGDDGVTHAGVDPAGDDGVTRAGVDPAADDSVMRAGADPSANHGVARDDGFARQPGYSQATRWTKGRRGLAVAASLFGVFFAIAVLVTWSRLAGAATYSTSLGERRTIMLRDGSTLELNARSSVRFRITDSERRAELLEGQALFKVAKDPQHPFVVLSRGTEVRAVGTQFDVKSRSDSTTVVTVIEGRVAIRESATQPASGSAAGSALKPVLLAAGERLTIAPDVASRPTQIDVTAAVAWTQGQLVFDNVPLKEVIDEFNLYSTRRLVVDDVGISRISGVFSSTDPASLVRFLKQRPGIVVTETERQIRISRH